MVDGKIVHNVKISQPARFQDVNVFAGDSYHPMADAEYWNLNWENTKLEGDTDTDLLFSEV